MGREFCLEQVARIDKLEQAVAELQREQHAHDDYSGCIVKPAYVYPIQPPTEQSDCDRCANKDGCNAKGEKCNDFVANPPTEQDKCKSCMYKTRNKNWGGCIACSTDNYSAYKLKRDKKYYCVCGENLYICGTVGQWDARCPNEAGEGYHYIHHGFYPTKAALIAELEKLPTKGEK